MADITWKISKNLQNEMVVRAEIGLKWAMFSVDGAHVDTGAGRSCEPSADDLAQMIADAPVNAGRLVAARQAAMVNASAPARTPAGSYDARVAGLRRSPASFARQMDREDSPF